MTANERSLQEAWLAAWEFAARVHDGQRSPGSGLPYIEHLGLVAMEVLAGHIQQPIDDPVLAVQCAILHDTIEDQGVTHAALAERFGVAVADGVVALSKNPALERSARMSDSLARIRARPRAVWCVKLADRITNLRPPPAAWPPAKIAAYRVEAELILAALGEAHGPLARRLAAKIAGYPSGRA